MFGDGETVSHHGSGGTATQQWTYATSGNAAGRLASESGPSFTRSFTYNANGEATAMTETLSGSSETLSLGYDSLGRITSIGYPVSVSGSALTVDYSYGASGYLSKVTNAADGTVYWQPQSGQAMDARGQWELYTLGGGLDIERLHDVATGAVTSVTAGASGGGSVFNGSYSYNSTGSLVTRNDLNEGVDESFDYDGIQQLTSVSRTAPGGNSSASFSYNKAGQFNQGPAGSYSYGSSPKHSPSSTSGLGNFSYDNAGDRLSGGGVSVSWNALGKARSVTAGGTTTNLTYGPDGGLVQAAGAYGGRYLGHFLKQAGASDWSARIMAMGRVIAVVKDSGGSASTEYLVHNHLGSPAAVATGGGSLMKRIAYGAWGAFVNPSTGAGSVNASSIAQYTTVTYTGHELLANSGLINMGARLYDAKSGLFLSPDPTVARPGDPMDLNQYAYVGDNPLSRVDPWGLDPIEVTAPYIPCPPSTVGTHEPNCYPVTMFSGSGVGGGASSGRAIGPANGGAEVALIRFRKNPGCTETQSGTNAWYQDVKKWLISHGFISAGARAAIPTFGGFGPVAGGSVAVTGSGVHTAGDLGVGAGAEANAVAGLQFGDPSSVNALSTTGAELYGPIGVVVTIGGGQDGPFVRVGIGLVAGEYEAVGPSISTQIGATDQGNAGCANR